MPGITESLLSDIAFEVLKKADWNGESHSQLMTLARKTARNRYNITLSSHLQDRIAERVALAWAQTQLNGVARCRS